MTGTEITGAKILKRNKKVWSKKNKKTNMKKPEVSDTYNHSLPGAKMLGAKLLGHWEQK